MAIFAISVDRVVMKSLRPLLTCTVCKNLLQDPTKICSKEHLSCATCVKVNMCCSVCNEIYGGLYKQDLNWVKVIAELQVTCIYNSSGCDWVGPIARVADHDTRHCKFRSLPCCYWKEGCRAQVSATAREQHELYCSFNIVRCERCNLPYSKPMTILHDSECEELIIHCPRGGNNCSQHTRAKSAAHAARCGFWRCTNATLGCTTTGSQKVISSHETYCTQIHNSRNLAVSAQKQAEEAIQVYHTAATTSDEQYRSLSERNNELKTEVDRLHLMLKKEKSRGEELEKTLSLLQNPVEDVQSGGRKRTRASTGGLDSVNYKQK